MSQGQPEAGVDEMKKFDDPSPVAEQPRHGFGGKVRTDVLVDSVISGVKPSPEYLKIYIYEKNEKRWKKEKRKKMLTYICIRTKM